MQGNINFVEIYTLVLISEEVHYYKLNIFKKLHFCSDCVNIHLMNLLSFISGYKLFGLVVLQLLLLPLLL